MNYKLRCIDLFSGYGGNSIGLNKYCKSVVYVEIEPYCQSIILNRMEEDELDIAPIWSNVKTFSKTVAEKARITPVDIITAGFPCQDISVAGKRKGLEGDRSSLVYEVLRLAEELQVPYLFFENVPNIRSTAAETISKELAKRGYDCRWCVISAASVGAPHTRERWFLLAYSKYYGSLTSKKYGVSKEAVSYDPKGSHSSKQSTRGSTSTMLAKNIISNTCTQRLETHREKSSRAYSKLKNFIHSCRWPIEPPVGRVANGIKNRMDRIKALGNGVVPNQVKKAFEILMCLNK